MKRPSSRLPARILLPFLLLITGCHVINVDENPGIFIPEKSLTVSDKGGIIQIQVECNVDITVSIDGAASAWIEKFTTKAMSASTYSFRIAPNPEYENRTGTITFASASHGISQTVTVTQLQKDALIIGGGTLTFGVEGGSFEIQVRHSIDYDFSISTDWIRNTSSRSLEEDILTFTVDVNPTLGQRRGTISFSGRDAGGNVLHTDVEVIQQGEEPTLILSDKVFTVTDRGETIEILVTSNLNLVISMEKETEAWIEETRTRTVTTSSLFFRIAPNTGYDSRTGHITFSDPVSGMSETVTVNQLQKDALVTGEGTVTIGPEAGSFQIVLGHNIDFTCSIDADWLSKGGTRAFTEETLSFYAQQNFSLEDREATISFRGTDAEGKALTLDVRVIQKGEERTILIPEREINVSDKGEIVEIEVSTNVDLTVAVEKGADAWIEQVPTRTVTSSSYFFRISPNTGYDPRSGRITFTDAESGLTETVTVNQMQKDALIVGSGEVHVDAEGGTFGIVVGHNVDYSFETDAEWITNVSTRAFTEETLTFSVEGNPSVDERTGTISFFGKDVDGHDLTCDVQVIQSGQIPYITLSVTELAVYSRGEAFSFGMESNFEPSVATDADWIVFSGRDSAEPDRLLFRADGNAGEEDRVGTISFPSPYLEDAPTVTVRQKGTLNGLGHDNLGVYAFGGGDWVFTVGESQILLSDAGSPLSFTLFTPADNRFFQTSGLLPFPEEGARMDVRITQNISGLMDAVINTSLTVESTDGCFARLSSDKGFTLVVKTR